MTGVAAFSAAQTADSGSFRQEGIASWYGKEFEGRPTASGEIFNPNLYTAAHPTLPFGTILTVTNKNNMRQVTVRINDRGPFVAARIIDLSRAAAESLDMIISGTAPVIVEQAKNTALGPVTNPTAPMAAPMTAPVPVIAANEPVFNETSPRIINLEPETPQARQETAAPPQPLPELEIVNVLPDSPMVQDSHPAPQISYSAPAAKIIGNMPPAESNKYYLLQVGAYKIPRNAINAREKLINAGLKPLVEKHGDFFRIVLAGISARDIPLIAQTLGDSGFREVLVREEAN